MMSATGIRLLAAALLITGATVAAAQAPAAGEGMVIWKSLDCGHFILQTKAGYGLFEWVSGPLPNDGDLLEGEARVPGEYRIENKTADVPTVVYLVEFSSSRAAIAARIPERCATKRKFAAPEDR